MSEHITHTPHIRRLERSSSDRMLSGVAGGLGRYFDLNPGFFRVGFVVLTLLGGAGVLIYLAALLVMPQEGAEQSLAEQALANRRDRPWPLVGLAVAGVALLILLTRATFSLSGGPGWIVVLLAGLGIFWASRGSRRSMRVLRAVTVLGVMAIAAVVAAVVLAFSWFNVSLDNGVGKRVYVPANAAEISSSYQLGVGKLRLDLSNVRAIGLPRHVTAKVGVGTLRVIVPSDIRVMVDAHAKVGDVRILGRDTSGRNVDVHVGSGSLTIDARVGAGNIEVVRAQ